MLFANFRRWSNLGAQRPKQARKPAVARRIRPTIEALEDRLAPAAIALPVPIASGVFGNSVAMSGNDVLVGAEGTNGSQGAAYLYNTSGTLLQPFTEPGSAAGDDFGFSVALSDNDVLVGAEGTNGSQGAAYLYNTSGTLLHAFYDPGNAPFDYFGSSVALSGNDVLVGAFGTTGGGAAYLYNTSGTLLHAFYDPGNAPFDYFGSSVALSGNDVLVGAFGTNGSQGAAYLYNTSGTLLQTFNDPGNGADQFGSSVALSGNDVLVGASNTNVHKGAAYLYNTSGTTPLQTYSDPGNDVGDAFGYSVALSGNDVLVGALLGNNVEGAAYLYNTSGTTPLQTFNDPGNTFYDEFGYSVALSGNDVLVGAPGPNGYQGAAYLYTGEISALFGNNQSTTVGTAFGTLLEAQVTDPSGNPVEGASVTFGQNFSVLSSAGALGFASETVTTNADGIAIDPQLTANAVAGSFTFTASSGGESATFNLTNASGAPAYITSVGGTPQSTTEGSAFGTLLQTLVSDSDGNPVADASVTFTVPTSGPTGTFDALATVPTNALGIATAPALIANHQTGGFIVTASVNGAATPADFDLTNTLIPATISVQGGSGQKETVGDVYATELQVKVVNAAKQPVSGISVDFETPGGGASGAFYDGASITNANGIAFASSLTADDTVGTFTVEAFVAGVANPAKFTLTNTAGAATAIRVAAGNNQSATVVKAYATALQTEVVDPFGNPVSGATVTFTIDPQANAGGAFPGAKLQIAETTNSSGIAKAPTLTANVTAGPFTITASVPGVATPATFNLTNNADPPYLAPKGAPETGMVGQAYVPPLQAIVTDKYGNPIAGVAVTFTAPASGPSGTFAGQRSAVAVTNADGVATAPAFTANTKAGRFVVTLSAHDAPVGRLILTNLPGPAAAVKVVGTATRITTLAGILRNLEVEVTDQYGNVVSGTPVTFTIQPNALLGATGSFDGAASVTQTSNTSGLAIAPPLTAAGKRGTFSVIARIAGVTSDAVFDLTVEG